MTSKDEAWETIFEQHNIRNHNFHMKPYYISAEAIKEATRGFKETTKREPRILCKQDTRESRPKLFKDNNLFILPTSNGNYVIVQGEGYVDIPKIDEMTGIYESQLDFRLDTARAGDSEMQHLDYAYATSLVRTFLQDDTLVLTIRGRHYTPSFSFNVNSHRIEVGSVQTEVDAGYEGSEQVVLVEAKNSQTSNVIIRQLFYPFKQWSYYTTKPVRTLFFEKRIEEYLFWEFVFTDEQNYNSIRFLNSRRYKVIE